MSRLVIAGLLIALVGTAAHAGAAQHCAKLVNLEHYSEEGMFARISFPGQKPMTVEYGGSLGTGLGISQWWPVETKSEYPIEQDDETGALTWNGRTYRKCK